MEAALEGSCADEFSYFLPSVERKKNEQRGYRYVGRRERVEGGRVG